MQVDFAGIGAAARGLMSRGEIALYRDGSVEWF